MKFESNIWDTFEEVEKVFDQRPECQPRRRLENSCTNKREELEGAGESGPKQTAIQLQCKVMGPRNRTRNRQQHQESDTLSNIKVPSFQTQTGRPVSTLDYNSAKQEELPVS